MLSTGFPFHSSKCSFDQAAAVRIVHRALVYHIGWEAAQAYVERHHNAVMEKVPTLASALSVLKELLGLPADIPILIAVDELAKFDSDNQSYASAITVQALKDITSFCDKRKIGSTNPVFPCVSVYGCIDLLTFSAGSDRRLYLQLLSPVFPFIDGVDVSRLPLILRAFASNPHRALLCKQKPKYDRVQQVLSKLLLTTGGIARRTSGVLVGLCEFDDAFPTMPTAALADATWASSFIDAVEGWLLKNEEKVVELANGQDRQVSPITLLPLNITSEPGACLEQFARDNAKLFLLNCQDERVDHLQSLIGSVRAYCQLLPIIIEGNTKVLTFVPLPVLSATRGFRFRPGAIFSTLSELGLALIQYSLEPSPPAGPLKGKPFERDEECYAAVRPQQ
jgi:hypothetical protein